MLGVTSKIWMKHIAYLKESRSYLKESTSGGQQAPLQDAPSCSQLLEVVHTHSLIDALS